MNSLVRRALNRLLPPTGAHRAADSDRGAATDDRPTMAIPRVIDPGPLVRPFYTEFERGVR